ncbi:hypothetical protein AX15_002525 [Amanita polypyramis BW_CC]|nr:hypothetical protein AX15_002525 [Amanita polypyramis BW_CC]
MDKSDYQGAPVATPIPEARTVADNSEHSRYRHAPLRVAIFSAVLLPVVLVPYLLTVRRTRMLRHRIDEVQNATYALRRELDTALAKLAAGKAENQGIKTTLHDVIGDTGVIKHRLEGVVAENGASRKDLDKLLAEAQHSRAQTAALRALGSSLADIAAFMHETELQMGLQPLDRSAQRRVDRLRIAALRLQNLSISQQAGASQGEEASSSSAKPADEQKTG